MYYCDSGMDGLFDSKVSLPKQVVNAAASIPELTKDVGKADLEADALNTTMQIGISVGALALGAIGLYLWYYHKQGGK